MLSGKEKRYLRKKAHSLKAIFQVGKDGIHENLLIQLNDALEKRELIKITVLQNCLEDKESIADQIIEGTAGSLVQIIGSQIIVYKESKENKKIQLPHK